MESDVPNTPNLLDAVQNIYTSDQIHAAETALVSVRWDSFTLLEDFEGAATLIERHAASEGFKLKHHQALDLATVILVGKRWNEVKNSFPAAYNVSLRYFGGQRRPVQLKCKSIREMAPRVIEELKQALADTIGAVIDVARSPYTLQLNVANTQGPAFAIECRGRWSSQEQAKFIRRLDDELGRDRPTVVIDHALRPHQVVDGEYAHAKFTVVKADDPSRTQKCDSELTLFAQFDHCRVTGIGPDETLLSGVGPLRVLASWRLYDEPFAGNPSPITSGQLSILFKRYQRLRKATQGSIEDLAKMLKELRGDLALSIPFAAHGPGEITFAVSVAAGLPMAMALGRDFFDFAVNRSRLLAIGRAVREVTLPLVRQHVESLQNKLERQHPGILARLDKMQFAAIQPIPRQGMGFGATDIMALGYWAHSHEVAGAEGRYSALEFGKRIDPYNLKLALGRDAIKTSVSCPECGKTAAASVTMLPTETTLGVWAVSCDHCGHRESVDDAPDTDFASSVPAFTCSCKACAERGSEMARKFGQKAGQFSTLLDKALVAAADHLERGTLSWYLDDDNIAHFGPDLEGRYSEEAVLVAGTGRNGQWYKLLPEEFKALQGTGRLTSSALASSHGYERSLSYCSLPECDGMPHHILEYALARAGFDPRDVGSFRKWAANLIAFAQCGTLKLPLLAMVRKLAVIDNAA
jgi:transcription elongation factor Elf1